MRLLRSTLLAVVSSGSIVACALTTDLDGYAGAPLVGVEADAGGDDGARDAAALDAAAAVDRNAAYGALVLAAKPAAYYRFDDGRFATAARDAIANNDAVVSTYGATFVTSGVRGGGVALDGDQWLDVGVHFDFAGLAPFALEMWMKPKSGTFQGELVNKRDQTVPDAFKGYVLYLAPGDRSVHFEAWGAQLSAWTNGSMPDPVSASGYSHVVVNVVYEKGVGNATVNIDGRRVGVGGFDNTTPLPATGTTHLLLGRGYVGAIDEVAIYDRALTPTEIDDHFAAGRD